MFREMSVTEKAREALSSLPFLAVSAALLLGFVAFVLPLQSASTKTYAAGGTDFDTLLLYSPSRALDMAAEYSMEGRLASIAAHWSLDLAFPLVYGFFLVCAWNFSLARVAPRFRWRGIASTIPLLGPAFDFMENICVTVLLASWPGRPRIAALGAAVGTAGKWMFVAAGFSGAVVLLFFAALAAVRKRTAG